MLIKLRDNLVLTMILIVASAAVYGVQYIIFQRGDETLFYLLQDLAFVPVQVLVVTLVINRFLSLSEKRKKVKKVNVIISTFFSETGTTLLFEIGKFNRENAALCEMLNIMDLKKEKSLFKGKRTQNAYPYDFYANPASLGELAMVMEGYKAPLLSMLENSNLLEHDSFTDMLWAVFHVADELKIRGPFGELDSSDIEHLSNDLRRAYEALVAEWIQYILYLKAEYPFLYVAALRKNPMQIKEEKAA